MVRFLSIAKIMEVPARFHYFLSHDWETSGTKKFFSMLLLGNSLAACLATMFCSVLLGLVRDTRRPEGLKPQRQLALSLFRHWGSMVVQG